MDKPYGNKVPAPIFQARRKPRPALFAHPNNSGVTTSAAYSGVTGADSCPSDRGGSFNNFNVNSATAQSRPNTSFGGGGRGSGFQQNQQFGGRSPQTWERAGPIPTPRTVQQHSTGTGQNTGNVARRLPPTQTSSNPYGSDVGSGPSFTSAHSANSMGSSSGGFGRKRPNSASLADPYEQPRSVPKNPSMAINNNGQSRPYKFQQTQQNRNPHNSGGFDRPSSVPHPFPGGRSTATQSGPSGLYGRPDQGQSGSFKARSDQGQSGSFGRSDQGQSGSFGRHDQDQFFSPQKGDQPWGRADTPSKAYSNRPPNAGGYQTTTASHQSPLAQQSSTRNPGSISENPVTTPSKMDNKPVDNSVHFITATIEGLRHWSQFADKMPMLFEVYGIVNSAVSSDSSVRMTFMLKDNKDTIQCTFFQIDRQLPRLIRGKWYRCVGNLDGESKSFKVASVRQADDNEVKAHKVLVSLCDRTLRRQVSALREM